ncbi:3-dehydroquinate synthase II [Desulfoplanes formicivorans]|uniref:3-dehydroquinate synthase n=1 Tax=Desulfoplanes formicivorans TaxID=1592317 RepID=A0A194AGW3_9BACT|nr:3-dehydroquinate synthase II [Desulfoplanes formicivorans]GAU08450.1 3-dehydroquinate synthase [Desulfoplanes formicivorans]
MRRTIYFKAIPFSQDDVTLALESGVDAIIAEPEHVQEIEALGRVAVIPSDAVIFKALTCKDDETDVVAALTAQRTVILETGWEIIPVENILAQEPALGLEVDSLNAARVGAGILEKGVATLVVVPQAITQLKDIVREMKLSQGTVLLESAEIMAITPVGLGHRVCVDTLSLLDTGQGMLVGNTSGFSFLVHAETETNPYVAPRPFRINAGGVHSYAMLPEDRTAYLEELAPGREVLIVGADGKASTAIVGRCKTEIRPMLMVTARMGERTGCVFLQNAETIRLVRDDGTPVSVVLLAPGDRILCHQDAAGRHFGMRIQEDIRE